MHILLPDLSTNFNSFFKQYYRSFCYFAYQFVQDQERSEDIVQEVFIRIFEKKLKFDDESHLKNWIYRSVRNECINYQRSSELQNSIREKIADQPQDTDSNFLNELIQTEIYQQLLDAIERLPEECKRVFMLCYLDDLSNEEVAHQLGLSVNTIKSQKNKAKIKLREQFNGNFFAWHMLLILLPSLA